MYGKVSHLVRPEHVWLAEASGALVGFVFCMPDALAMERGEAPDFIVKTLAVRPGRRMAGLGSLLVARAQRAAADSGFRHAIHALQHETNSSLRITDRCGGEVMRRYALYARKP
jgi:L-amino acid N-acyltransferase YncA